MNMMKDMAPMDTHGYDDSGDGKIEGDKKDGIVFMYLGLYWLSLFLRMLFWIICVGWCFDDNDLDTDLNRLGDGHDR